MRAGHEVCGIVHKEEANFPWQVTACDLLDLDALTQTLADQKPDAVAHLAAISFVQHGDARTIYQTNVVGTRNLLEAIGRAGCNPHAVLLASSANVYGNTDCGVVDEQVAPSPINDYAISKLAMEWVARMWEGRLPITIVRPFNYTGAGQAKHFLLPKIVSHFQEKASRIELGNLHVVRDFSDVRTVVSVYRRLLDGHSAGKTLNVCSGIGYSLQDILAMMLDLTGHNIDVAVNPNFVRPNEVHKLVGSRQALEMALGPIQPVPLRDTLAWMLTSGPG